MARDPSTQGRPRHRALVVDEDTKAKAKAEEKGWGADLTAATPKDDPMRGPKGCQTHEATGEERGEEGEKEPEEAKRRALPEECGKKGDKPLRTWRGSSTPTPTAY